MTDEPKKKPFLNVIAPWLLGFYFVVVFVLFLAELGVPVLQDYVRTTDQVLILLVILVLPAVLIGTSRFIQTISIKLSGQELHLQMSELKENVRTEVGKVESNLGIQVSNAEQALWPMLAGKDLNSPVRLAQKKLIIGSKLDHSHLFFGYLLKLCIEKFVPGASCEVRFPNGGSMKNFADIQNHWIDIYIDSSGTVCQYFNIDHKGKSDEQIHDELNHYGKGLGLQWLNPLGASEDYCLVMAPDNAKAHNVSSIRDLKMRASELVFSGDPEFLNRKDCYLGLRKYGIEFKQVKPCRIIDRYEAMKSGEADVFVGYETDPELQSGQAIRLKDPDEFFPRYLTIPTVSMPAMEAIPELSLALEKSHNVITTDELIMAVSKLSKHNGDPDIARGLAEQVINRLG